MGMFNYVDFDGVCPKCGHKVEWQTKDGDLYLDTVAWSSVNEFHTFCSNCKTSSRYMRKIPPPKDINDYELVID